MRRHRACTKPPCGAHGRLGGNGHDGGSLLCDCGPHGLCDSTVRPDETPDRRSRFTGPGRGVRSARLNGLVPTPLPANPDPALCAALAADLRDAGFHAEALRSAWGDVADDAIARGLRRPADRALGDRADPLAVLGRLLVLGMPQPADLVAAALPRTRRGRADRARTRRAGRRDGALRHPSARARAPAAVRRRLGRRLRRHRWWIASDLDEAALGGPLPESHVLGVGRRVADARRAAADDTRGVGARPRHRMRHPGAARTPDRRPDRRDRHLGACAGVRPAERAAQRGRRHRDARAGACSSRSPASASTGSSPTRRSSSPRASPGCRSTSTATAGMVGDDARRGVRRAGRARTSSRAASHSCSATGRPATASTGSTGCAGGSRHPRCRWTPGSSSARVLDPLSYAELWIRDGGTLPGTPAFARLDRRVARRLRRARRLGDRVRLRAAASSGCGRADARAVRAGRPAAPGGREPRPAPRRRPRRARPARGARRRGARGIRAHRRARRHRGASPPARRRGTAGDRAAAGRRVRPDDRRSTPAWRRSSARATATCAVGVLIDAIAELLEVDAVALRADLLPRVRELVFTGFLRLP